MTKDEALRMALDALESNRRTHHYCEDTWYSCPKHEDGCANDSESDECNCGVDKANAGIDQAITAIKKTLAQPKQEFVIDGDTSDGYHTFNELYEFRKAYNVALFNEWAAANKCSVHKSWRHHDGEKCFGGGWFIVVAITHNGQISNHYEAKDWDLFKVPEVEKAVFEFDGHTGSDVINRLKTYTALAQPEREWIGLTEMPKQEHELALYQATQIATWLWKNFYKDTAPQWEVLPDICGVLSQIDNMVAGMKYDRSAPKREWVGLTDEEIDKTYETQAWDARRSYARAIEAKLKEKRNL